MEIILLERVEHLGQMGDVVRVRDGYARNFLLPRKKALRATRENRVRFESERVQIEARNLALKEEAQKLATRVDGTAVVVVRQAGDTGILYGSVSNRDVAEALTEAGLSIDRRQVQLQVPIKRLGIESVRVALHPEVIVQVSVNVARSEAEAAEQASRAAGIVAVAAPVEVNDEDLIADEA